MRVNFWESICSSGLVSQGPLPEGFSHEVDEHYGCPHCQPSMPRFKPSVLAVPSMACAVKATEFS